MTSSWPFFGAQSLESFPAREVDAVVLLDSQDWMATDDNCALWSAVIRAGSERVPRICRLVLHCFWSFAIAFGSQDANIGNKVPVMISRHQVAIRHGALRLENKKFLNEKCSQRTIECDHQHSDLLG